MDLPTLNINSSLLDLDEATRKRRQTVVDFLRISCRLSQDFTEEVIFLSFELHNLYRIKTLMCKIDQ